ncbi:hypothetical protein C2G38_755471 [Gigaspora rosea]|uniref:BTB domain-containing protein n=1 Tax=Gigaspora rosea TaxID=44941 RepID=A0A397VNA8_9GLOM|nr:hypothetical protein C2G38_755471 [Gigaspora rosea]
MENLLGKLSTDFLELLNDKEDYNVIINVGNSPNSKRFQAHSNILRYRSLYFKNELLDANKDENNIKTIELKHITIQQFDFIIKYIYGGIISLENLEISFILDLILISYEFLMYELAEHLETHLIENNKNRLLTKFPHVYEFAFKTYKLWKLQNWCINIASKYPEKIFDSDDFTSLQEYSLISLLKCDNLQMDEVKIWNYVIKWGLAQNPDLPNDPKIWSHENLLAMKLFSLG